MKTFSYFLKNLLTEELHHEINEILNGNKSSGDKLSLVTDKIRELIAKGESAGVKDDTPNMGSSRAVFFPTDMDHIILDGTKTKIPTAVKIAYPGDLDWYCRSPLLLGEHQNKMESNRDVTNEFSLFHKNPDGSYTTNPSGVLVPHIDHHENFHWMKQGYAPNISEQTFQKLTQTPHHPHGVPFEDMYNHILNVYNEAHGISQHNPTTLSFQHLETHPFLKNLRKFVFTAGLHPADNYINNWGIFEHPITRKSHPVLRDYGFSADVANLYENAKADLIWDMPGMV